LEQGSNGICAKALFRFPLTTPRLNRRIVKWISGGTLLKLQRPLKLG
jgi:hypothetical protein